MEQYDSQGLITRVGLRVAGPALRAWDKKTAANVTTFLANSTHTAREIARCYERESTVVHPPVRTNMFTPDASVAREDFWLVAGALEPYKRADLAIRAARHAKTRIVIAGGGTQFESLRREFEGPGVVFLGRVSDAKLIELYRKARVLLFPQVEDFGIVAVEAQACGTPVLARRAGGALDTVIEGRTGAFFDHPDPVKIAEAAKRLPGACTVACRENALQFSEAVFDAKMRSVIRDHLVS
jgi:glycosyltransferase involved in cell wall biosynthesis